MSSDTPMPEFQRMIKARLLPGKPVVLSANETECAALAERFGIAAIKELEASLTLEQTGAGISARGPLNADLIQSCAVSGEDLAITIREDLELLFVEDAVLAARDLGDINEDGAIEVELPANEADEIGYTGDAFDLGEAAAQSLGLAIDPYAEGPGADAARAKAGIADESAPSGPLANALSAALKKS